jgi:hypothetical protein
MKRHIDNINSHRTGVSTFASHTSLSTDQSLQKSFHLSHADKIKLKKIASPSENKKHPTAQTNTTQTMTVKLNRDNGLQGRTDRTPAGNTGFASGGVTCKLGALCFYSSSVLVDSFVLRNPPERKARNRYTLCYGLPRPKIG